RTMGLSYVSHRLVLALILIANAGYFLLATSVAIFDVTPFSFEYAAPAELYTLSLHDALPIWCSTTSKRPRSTCSGRAMYPRRWADRKSTRLNSSHEWISYAVFCLKKKRQGPGEATEEGRGREGRESAGRQ